MTCFNIVNVPNKDIQISMTTDNHRSITLHSWCIIIPHANITFVSYIIYILTNASFVYYLHPFQLKHKIFIIILEYFVFVLSL